jgi:hypothetical protein
MRLSWPEIRANAAVFSDRWREAHYEKGQTHSFYDEFFAIFGVPRVQVATYEKRVEALDARRRGFIDLFWPGTLIVEQKSRGRDLQAALVQALDYVDWLPEAQRPRHVLVSDFQRFELTDLETRREWRFPLPELKRHVEAFGFILGVQPRIFRNQSPVNAKASELMGRLHQRLAADGYTGHNLERLLVRLLFILFADDTGIFQRKDQFLVWLERRTAPDGRDLGEKLGMLFQTLDTPPERRQRGLDADLADFPYINGELFRERIDMPAFDHAMRDMLLDASLFNWGEVSPAIFGSLFESVIDRVTRRAQGAHYTPEEAIQKVIGPLFLDELKAEFARIRALKAGRDRALAAFQERLGGLRFLDPACGAGNFLVVAYRELRELEREVIRERRTIEGTIQQVMDVSALSRLNVDQFHGIEVDEFPSQIAQVALWMTDHIANTRLGQDFGRPYARIPLVTAPGIRHADALAIDWEEVLPAAHCTHVLGNPPFVGAKFQTAAQRGQVRALAGLPGSGGTLDYVAAWFIKAARYVAGGAAAGGEGRIGFVSTNSITQGEQVAQLWPILFREGVEIAFAHRTFVWPGRAAVHCVIVGLAPRGCEPAEKRLFTYADARGEPAETRHGGLTAYLFDAGAADRHLVVKEEARPINEAPRLLTGSKPLDGGHLVLDAAERAALLAVEPGAEAVLRRYQGAHEFINGYHRWVIAAFDAAPAQLRALPHVRERLRRVRDWRLASESRTTLAIANEPARWHVTVLPQAPYLVIPNTSSERRDYIPIGWIEADVVPNQKLRVLLDATPWQFGVLTSRMHMAWMRQVTGRMKSDYMYSVGVVYNNFPWPDASAEQAATVERLAKAVLDARALPRNAASSLADLYDPDTMPAELRRAHRELDQAVDRLYRLRAFGSDRERVEHLFGLYQQIAAPLVPTPTPARRGRRG